MSARRYHVPDDIDALRRENELLALENDYLKTRIAGLEQELERLRPADEAAQVDQPADEDEPVGDTQLDGAQRASLEE